MVPVTNMRYGCTMILGGVHKEFHICRFDKKSNSFMNTRNIWVPDFTYVYSGRSYTFQPKLRIGPDFWRDQIFILLRKGFQYEIFVHEQNFFVTNGNSDTLPFKFIRISPDDAKDFKFFYTISVIQHIEKNVPADPCVENDQYTFTTCVKESLARKVGCRPSWDVWSDQTIRNCTDIKEHR